MLQLRVRRRPAHPPAAAACRLEWRDSGGIAQACALTGSLIRAGGETSAQLEPGDEPLLRNLLM